MQLKLQTKISELITKCSAVLLRAFQIEEPFQLKKNYPFLILNKTPNSISTHALLYFRTISHKSHLKLNWKKSVFTHLPEVCCDTPGNNGLFPLCYMLTLVPPLHTHNQLPPHRRGALKHDSSAPRPTSHIQN